MPKKSHDFNIVAFSIVAKATGEALPKAELTPLTGRKSSSSKGGLKGGVNRMRGLTDEQRSELGRRAALKRWGKTAPVGTEAVRVKSTK